jgi:hypothetical protein
VTDEDFRNQISCRESTRLLEVEINSAEAVGPGLDDVPRSRNRTNKSLDQDDASEQIRHAVYSIQETISGGMHGCVFSGRADCELYRSVPKFISPSNEVKRPMSALR